MILDKKWYVYILRCENNSLYTGITTDVKKRFLQHSNGKGAKYTRVHKPIKIEAVFITENRSSATKEEIRIKRLTKAQKERLCKNSFNDILNITN
ncbi:MULTISPECIES: GIY-YIG nuclease family protein [Cetobacterium]|jgi:putative endonuclease|uniref:GIY-YIG nuclease family protein n=1 Tax=Candidatus Cetobacterium colombiensis TaxID=3073100 RepID=A0ABU4W673_9FUSO|nr:GIY-YIG nuclease family protein [Candidatus Cetobacterium colombiensis]MDX8335021.1 GIY-YIG nuclease family protein [Candidatus Cetobacterium colombiensis]